MLRAQALILSIREHSERQMDLCLRWYLVCIANCDILRTFLSKLRHLNSFIQETKVCFWPKFGPIHRQYSQLFRYFVDVDRRPSSISAFRLIMRTRTDISDPLFIRKNTPTEEQNNMQQRKENVFLFFSVFNKTKHVAF